MRKILKVMLFAVIACVTAITVSLCACAETEDVEVSTSIAKTTNGEWGQSVTYPPNLFDCTRMTADTIVKVEFELEEEWTGSGAPVELVLQNYSVTPQIWAKVEPFECDETTASFRYEDMVTRYGSDDFSGVGNLCIGDCGIVMKVTKVTVTNCTVIVTTTTEATTTTAAETSAEETTTQAPAETTEVAVTTAASSDGGGQIPLIPIIIGAVVVAIVVVVIIIIRKNRKDFY